MNTAPLHAECAVCVPWGSVVEWVPKMGKTPNLLYPSSKATFSHTETELALK